MTITDNLIKDLSKDFLLKDEGSVEDFLGVHIHQKESEHGQEIHLHQCGLINDVLSEMELLGPPSPTKFIDTPAKEILTPDPDGDPFKAKWSYRSIIGKLNFLAQNTRPDISCAVHQCAKYSINPKQSHGFAVKRICKCLRATMDKGLILCPDGTHQLHAHSDSNFAGNWTPLFAHLRESHFSRAGCVITYSGCPIFWQSKLESEIALSTCEAECIALSMCCRQLIPLRRILDELYSIFQVPFDTSHTEVINELGCSVVLEDNSAALALATDGDKCRPRTEHLSLKWHHFRDQVRNGGWLKIKKVHTKVNWADIFTKPLPKPQFQFLRDAMMGWRTKHELQDFLKDQHVEALPIHPLQATAAFAFCPESDTHMPPRKRVRFAKE